MQKAKKMTNKTQSSHYDVAVVGARCAGASTAMLLARQGLRVVVVDRSREGSDTLSTHALMRGAVVQLSHWGLLESLAAAETPPIEMTSFFYEDEIIDIPIKTRDGVGALYAPRRTVLDPLLVASARRVGAHFLFGTSLVGLIRDRDGRVRGICVKQGGRSFEISADLVIGADGIRSTMAQLVEAQSYRRADHATGVIFGYWSGLPVKGYRWYYRPGVSAGAIPTNQGLTCIFVSTTATRFRDELSGGDASAQYLRLLREAAPDLAHSVERGQLMQGTRSFPGIRGYFRQSWGPGWALVGDAGYFRDPLTAHGITDALRDSELLYRAVVDGSPGALAGYQAKRDELALGFFEATDRIASFEWTLEELKELHISMSQEMKREVETLTKLHSEAFRKTA